MSTTSSDVSQASTKINDDVKPDEKARRSARQVIKHAADSTTAQDVLLFLIAFRILNALSVRTFFQPDEYFQSLEPAWEVAFGSTSGAWITWVWNKWTTAKDVLEANTEARNGENTCALRYIQPCSPASIDCATLSRTWCTSKPLLALSF